MQHRRVSAVAAAGCCGGLVTVVVGTFLPWLRSGATTRASYDGLSSVRDFWHPRGIVSAVVTCWPWVGLACAVAAALVVAGHHLTVWVTLAGGVLCAACAVTAGLFALFVLRRGPDTLIVRIDQLGPVVTLCGAAVAGFCSPALLISAVARKLVSR